MGRLFHVFVILCLTELCFGAVSSSCPPDQYLQNDARCCYLCPPGSFMFRPCASPGIYPLCNHCLNGMYTDRPNMLNNCLPCHQCDADSQYEERKCDQRSNRKCSCRKGFHEYDGKCVLKESSAGEIDFSYEVIVKIVTCTLFSCIFMMAIFIIILVIQRQKSVIQRKKSVIQRKLSVTQRGKHTPVSEVNVDEETENLEPEAMTLLHAVYEHDDEQTETKITEMMLSTLRRKYAVSPTLDTNSANQQIVISSNHWMASLSGFDQLYPEHPHRFTTYKQVLAKESFFSGRYYWEVDVSRAHNYEIGIASESMQRRGDGWECLLGWNVNSWCVAKHDGEYTARHDAIETKLNMLGDPMHLGLCLDCDSGDVVFYAVINSFSWLMHTFNLDVNEPLKPALCFCNIGDVMRFFSLQCYDDNHPGMLHL
uniref:butyrophilin subfamily 2 member A1-like isoform X2 n=1 Tax=Myxine glutinosa TaxID=7769 RepID=UPI00358E8041